MANLGQMDKYLKPVHIENGDEVKFLDKGEILEKDFKGEKRMAFEITVQLPNGDEKTASLNKTSRKILSDSYGLDTEKWKGKKALITKNKMMVGDGMKDVLIFQAVAEEKLF
jgi:hypothetical protein